MYTAYYIFLTIIVVLLVVVYILFVFFFFKQKTAYEMRISDWSSDVCSSDLFLGRAQHRALDLLRRRARVWQRDEDERRRHLREGFQRQPHRRDQADHEQRHEEHDRRDGTADAELRNAHAGSPSASIASCAARMSASACLARAR